MTYDIKALRDIEKRLAEAKGPDRLIDFHIGALWCEVLAGELARASSISYPGGEFRLTFEEVDRKSRKHFKHGFIADYCVPFCTASLDAAVALVERVLPGHAIAIGTMKFKEPSIPWATIWTPGGVPDFQANAQSPALALCLATVRALISQGEQ